MGLRKLGPSQYVVCVVRTDPRTGRKKEVKRKFKGTESQAKKFEQALATELLEERRERITLAGYATSWLELREPNIKASTAAKYATDLGHILERLGDIYVDKLRPTDIKAYINLKLETQKGWTVATQLRLLRQLAKDAVAEGLTEIDFCARVPSPVGKKYTEDDPNLLDAEELGKVLAYVEGKEPLWYPLVATMAMTGLRWGEATGLQWSDLDEEKQRIKVRRNNWKGRVLTPKTTGSYRSVPYGPALQRILKAHRTSLLAEQHPGLKGGWCFANGKGGLQTGGPLTDVMRRALKACGIEKVVTPHGLRRTFNNLTRQVANQEVVRSITGHATEAMFEHYSVVGSAEKVAAQGAMLKLVKGES